MLDKKVFRTVVQNSPLVSLDICLVCDGYILFGKRNNDPLKGEWFTPGGRIFKNEAWQCALLRIAKTELELSNLSFKDFYLMGVWDHFYGNSIFGHDISTHYINLPHYIELPARPRVITDNQHSKFSWFELSVVCEGSEFHPYMRNYASWLLNKKENTDD